MIYFCWWDPTKEGDPKKLRKTRAVKDTLNAEQLRFHNKLLGDLHWKARWTIVSPFYEPIGTYNSYLRTVIYP